MFTTPKFAPDRPSGRVWHLQLLADALLIVTFCGLAATLSVSFT